MCKLPNHVPAAGASIDAQMIFLQHILTIPPTLQFAHKLSQHAPYGDQLGAHVLTKTQQTMLINCADHNAPLKTYSTSIVHHQHIHSERPTNKHNNRTEDQSKPKGVI
jgi:hypothetical protein